MKKFAKFIPVALGLLTLASCSNDDFLSEKAQDAVSLEKGEMLVTIDEPQEEGEAFTRGYTSRDMQKRRWYSGMDKLRVYGSQFGAFDVYQFQQNVNETSGKFKIVSNPSYVQTAKWALFPFDQISNGKWDIVGGLYNSESSVDITLPQVIEYDAAYDAANYATDKSPYYLDDLPRWGEVTSINNGEYLSTSLKWMTGILRLQLDGTPTYANAIRVQLREAGDVNKTLRVNGDFHVKIAQNDVMIPDACIRTDGHVAPAKVGTDGALYVYIPETTKLTAEDNVKSVIYLPLPVWDKQVDIVVSINDPSTPAKKKDDLVNGGKITWKEYATLKNKTIVCGKVYGNKNAYNLAIDGTNPEAITDALELIETSEETIILKANNPIDVCAKDNHTTIEIPNKNGVKNIIIDLSKGLDGCAADQTMKIVYKNTADKFKGNVTLITPSTKGTNPVKLDVDLDESGFAIAGNNASKAAVTAFDIDAAEFVVGDGKLATSVKYAAVTLSENVKALTIAVDGVIDDVAINPGKFSGVKTVTVKGEITKGITATDNVVDVKVEGDAAVVKQSIVTKGKVDINSKSSAFTGAITADGDITIAGEAKTFDPITSKEGKVTLSGKVQVLGVTAKGDVAATDEVIITTNDVKSEEGKVTLSGKATVSTGNVEAKGDITITEEANAPKGTITSKEGNIVIDNTKEFTYEGAVTATKGSVTLNATKAATFSAAVTANVDLTVSGKVTLSTASEAGQDVILKGEAKTVGITAGRDYSVTESAWTEGDVSLKRTATVNVTKNGGDFAAVTGKMAFADGADYALKLTSGLVGTVDATAGEVKLTFASTPAMAAIKTVTTPNNLIPQNKSIWNGVQLSAAAYAFDAKNKAVWTASQLAYLLVKAQTEVTLRSDIDLNNQEWKGINATAATTINGCLDNTKSEAYWQSKTISNVNLTNPSNQKEAGFIATASAQVTMSGITFDGVKTTFDMVSGDAMEAVGAVIGSTTAAVDMTRISVKLAGTKFGSDGINNLKSANIGGLVGKIAGGVAELKGVKVDATATALSGWYSIGGFIGSTANDINIKLAEADNKLKAATSEVKGLKINVTHVDKANENDLFQGMTGLLMGSSTTGNITITDYKGDVKEALTITGADESKAFMIHSLTGINYFGRADQTLVGHNGKYEDNKNKYLINGVVYQIYQEGGKNYTAGNKHFYDLTKKPHAHN